MPSRYHPSDVIAKRIYGEFLDLPNEEKMTCIVALPRQVHYRGWGANGSAVADEGLYLTDSKKCFGIIRAALSLLKSVYVRRS